MTAAIAAVQLNPMRLETLSGELRGHREVVNMTNLLGWLRRGWLNIAEIVFK